MEKSNDWLRQAKRDLEHAIHSLENEEYEWVCFASQQAAEKAIKAVYQKLCADVWGHSISNMISKLPTKVDDELIDIAKELDKYYIPTRYPNFHPEGAPLDYYTKNEAKRAIEYAKKIISFCEDNFF